MVYVDTSAYFALADPTDAAHEAARAALDRLRNLRYAFHTSNLVVAETHALMLNRIKPWHSGREVGLRFLSDIYDHHTARVTVVRQREFDRARKILVRYADKAFTLTDAVSFVVMETRGIREAFSFDEHFEQYGFHVHWSAT